MTPSVKETEKGNKFLQISENRPLENGEWLRNEITVFEEHVGDFVEEIKKANQSF